MKHTQSILDEDVRFNKAIRLCVHTITALVGLSLSILLYIGWEWLHP